MKSLLCIICLLTTLSLLSQKDSIYYYDICVGQKAKLGTVDSSFSVFVDDISHTRLTIKILDRKKNAVENSIITISLSKNDSIILQAQLDSRNTFSTDELKPDRYNIKVQSITNTPQIIKNVPLINNRGVHLTFELGQTSAFISMTLKSNKKLSRRQLKRRIAKTEMELNK